MATLVSPGVSVTVTDESFFIPQSAPTLPLFFIATEANKRYLGNDTVGTREHSIVRTITSKTQALNMYGVPRFRQDSAGNPMHGDCRNEYGLFALHQFLDVGSRAFVVRADVDLADADATILSAVVTPMLAAGNGSVTTIQVDQVNAVAQLWTLTANSATTFRVQGFVSGDTGIATVGQTFDNGEISFKITADTAPYAIGDTFELNIVASTVTNPLGANDAAKRVSIVHALQAEINSNQDVRSERFEYNLIVCPGYYETVDELLNLSLSIGEEAFVVADTPMHLNADDVANWSMTSARYRSCNVAYYYPHGLASNLDGNDVMCAASGIALKTIAYSDTNAEVFMAPAGARRGLVYGVSQVGYFTGPAGTPNKFIEVNLNQGQRDNLYEYQKNLNPIVFFPGRGIIIWGQKTSAPAASAMDRINVVRLLMMVRRDIRKGMFPFVFEPNDKLTREAVKSVIDGYLGDILIRRGLYDYLVVCDDINNTPTRIDRNELWAEVLLKPVRAVEFIYVPIRVLSTAAKMG